MLHRHPIREQLRHRARAALHLQRWVSQVVFVLGRATGDVLAVRVVEERRPGSDLLVRDLLVRDLLGEVSAPGDVT